MINNFWWSGKLSEPFFGRTASSEIFLKIQQWSRLKFNQPRSGSQIQNRRKFYPKSWKNIFPLCLKSFLNRSWTLCGCFYDRKQPRNVSFRSIFVTPRAGLVGPRRGVSPNPHKRSIWRRKSDQKSRKIKILAHWKLPKLHQVSRKNPNSQ